MPIDADAVNQEQIKQIDNEQVFIDKAGNVVESIEGASIFEQGECKGYCRITYTNRDVYVGNITRIPYRPLLDDGLLADRSGESERGDVCATWEKWYHDICQRRTKKGKVGEWKIENERIASRGIGHYINTCGFSRGGLYDGNSY